MINKILSYVMGFTIIIAIIIGLFYRQSYTNITTEPMFIENHFSVALLDESMVPDTLFETMRNNLPNSKLILRVKSQGEIDFEFKNIKQYVEVTEVYEGEGVAAGEEIVITSHNWALFFDDMTANLNFVNFMQPNQEYLLFLEEKWHNPDPNNDEKVYAFSNFIIPPIFSYKENENATIDLPRDSVYVPYSEVKNNEFFISSENLLNDYLNLKLELIEIYSK